MIEVDYTQPIEAVNEDGTVISATCASPANDGWHWVRCENHPGGIYFNANGEPNISEITYRIRNVTPTTQSPTPDQIARMTALVERMAGNKYAGIDARTEARAILAAMKPVDSDLIEARRLSVGFKSGKRIEDEILSGKRDGEEAVQAIYQALKRGRELERGE